MERIALFHLLLFFTDLLRSIMLASYPYGRFGLIPGSGGFSGNS